MMKPKDKRTVHYSFKASEVESDRIIHTAASSEAAFSIKLF